MSTPLIEIRNLRKAFQGKTVLDGVNLTIPAGCLTAVIGKSGEGKSVLLRHIIGLVRPDAGDVWFEGQALGQMGRASLRRLRGTMAYMFQGMALFDSLTVFENVALPLREKFHLPESQVQSRVLPILAQLELAEVPAKFPSQLSGGMKKRVALARALVTQPKIILFDEPTTGLDPLRKRSVFKLIDNSRKTFGFTAVMVSHDVPDVFHIAQNVALLDRGRIVFQGSAQQAVDSDLPLMRAFMPGPDEAFEDD